MLVIGVAVGSVAFPTSKTVTATNSQLITTNRKITSTLFNQNGETVTHIVTQTETLSPSLPQYTVVVNVLITISRLYDVSIVSWYGCNYGNNTAISTIEQTTITQTSFLILMNNDTVSSLLTTENVSANNLASLTYSTQTFNSASATTTFSIVTITGTLGTMLIVPFCPPTNHP